MSGQGALKAVPAALLLATGICSRAPIAEERDHSKFRLDGTGCRRKLIQGDTLRCNAVVVNLGPNPCVPVLDGPSDGGPWKVAFSRQFGSGCEDGGGLPYGEISRHLVFVEQDGEGYEVLCDGARVLHDPKHASAVADCFATTGPW